MREVRRSDHRQMCRRIQIVVLIALVLFIWLYMQSAPRPSANNDLLQSQEQQEKTTDSPVKLETLQKMIEDRQPYVSPKRDVPYNFTGFNNVTGLQTGGVLVPNFVHFLRFDQTEFDFLDFVSVVAAFKHQRPERLFFHTNVERFKGTWWEKLLLMPGFADIVHMVKVEVPKEIFGQPMDNGYHVWHAGDITRIRILQKYGGIFLDSDSYLVKSLDKFRRFEMTIGWDEDQFLGTQVIVAHPDARFLHEWLETYRGHYDKNKWYYNAGERPTVEVLYKRPELIHRIKLLFGVHYLIHKLYKADEIWASWRDQYAIHLLKRHQSKTFDEENFLAPATTIRDMILDVYDPVSESIRID